MLLEPRWRSKESGNTEASAFSCQEVQAIRNRTSRLRRVTGLKMVDFLGRHVGGKVGEPGDSQQLNLDPLLEAMENQALTARDIAGLLQFETSTFRGEVRTYDDRVLEPIDETRIAAHVQENLDELAAMGVGVLVARSVRFMPTAGDFAHMNNMQLNQGTVFFEKVAHVRKPAPLTRRSDLVKNRSAVRSRIVGKLAPVSAR